MTINDGGPAATASAFTRSEIEELAEFYEKPLADLIGEKGMRPRRIIVRALHLLAAAQTQNLATMHDTQVEYMVSRFLRWKLPDNFNPDCGISFSPLFNENTPWPKRHEPSGTNLFDAVQAEAMVRHMIEGMPSALTAALAKAGHQP